VVDTDQALGARQATEHLLGLGHRQVWHIAGPETSFSAVHREQAWRRTLEAAGITPPGYEHGRTLGERKDVTAIFAANDQMGLGAMRALHELGRDIPAEISIVGFDDMDVARSFWPPLTTVRQDFAAVGRLSIRKLLRKVSDASAQNDTAIVPTELIIRGSTAAPRQSPPSVREEN
jgi:DNA-binding LacI/PurR family transcriptional regulator